MKHYRYAYDMSDIELIETLIAAQNLCAFMEGDGKTQMEDAIVNIGAEFRRRSRDQGGWTKRIVYANGKQYKVWNDGTVEYDPPVNSFINVFDY